MLARTFLFLVATAIVGALAGAARARDIGEAECAKRAGVWIGPGVMVGAAAVPPGCYAAMPQPLDSVPCLPDDTECGACVAGGGVWAPQGLYPEPICSQVHPDGGRFCVSSQECAGDCLVWEPEQAVGICSAISPTFGCFGSIEDRRIICID